MSDFLKQMAKHSRERVNTASRQMSLAQIREHCAELPEPVELTTTPGKFGIIAELKMRSPSEGVLDPEASAGSIIVRTDKYIEGGASALSVLTEPSRFGGSLTHLQEVSAIAHEKQVPVMRKDFLVDIYQLFEARANGADGVLLIARILDDTTLTNMLDTATQLDLFVLLEAFDETDLARCARFANKKVLIGLNCRDLATLQINPQRFFDLFDKFPESAVKVAESGVHSVEDAKKLAQGGYDMALIGTALMKTEHPELFLNQITGGKLQARS